MRIDHGLRRLAPAALGALAVLATAPHASAQSALINNQARATGQARAAAAPDDAGLVGAWPKIGFETVGAVEYAGMSADSGRDRPGSIDLRFDSTALVEFADGVQLDALFQYKSKQPRPTTDANAALFSNQGAGRRNGGRFKELYFRNGDWRYGKFVQDFGRAYANLPGPFATDLVEEPEDGYEPAEMLGVEKLHVYDNENGGWSQISFAAFMIDRTPLHETFPYNEGRIRYKDGGVGNTRLPENLMVTWDVLNKPVGSWAQMNYQASVIRWGKAYGAERGEWWTTLGADISIPLTGTVEDTLRNRYSQINLYVEGARRDNFDGVAGRTRQFLSGSAEYLNGPWVFDLTTTQRWTSDRLTGKEHDALYTASIGYSLPSDTVAALSVASERVGGRDGVYAGLRITQTLTSCNRCLTKGRPF
ncbi:MAG TPA: hypothetical protein VL460_00675 [Caulobacteraceae bacterium]|jgi:hypothetical protein|nr:hypothetical protein [Caulobacteraceae bacterium]